MEGQILYLQTAKIFNMKQMTPDNINAEITPTEFEQLIHSYLIGLGQSLTEFKATHDTKIERYDGTYQIDVYVEFEALGALIKVLVECKRYKNKVERETVQLLNGKLQSTGAHKGMIFATSGFQTGAIQYANEHGIALIRVIEGRFTYFALSQDSPNFEPPPWANIPKYAGEYRNGHSISILQRDYLDPLKKFLFDE